MKFTLVGATWVTILASTFMSPGLCSGGDLCAIRTISKGSVSGITTPTQRLLKDRLSWQAIWKDHSATQQLPEIDFTQEMVVVVAMGQQHTGGYQIEVDRVEVVDKRILIFVHQVVPKPGAIVTEALTSPFHFIATVKKDLEAEFRVYDTGTGRVE